MNPVLDEAKEWLEKAKNDLLSARILAEHDPPMYLLNILGQGQRRAVLLTATKGFFGLESSPV